MSKKPRRPTSRETEQLSQHLAQVMNDTCQEFKVSPNYCIAALMGMYAAAGDEDAIERMQCYLDLLAEDALQAEIEKYTSSLPNADTRPQPGWAVLKNPK